MPKLQLPPSEALYPVPVVLVSCVDKSNGRANIVTIAWCGVVCSSPPVLSVSIRPSRHSHRLITGAKDFVINIPTADMVKKVDACGIKSGRDIDKFKVLGFTAMPATKVSSPLIRECPVNIECRLKDVIKLGAHDMFLGEVVCVHADDSVVSKDRGIDFTAARPLVYNQGEYWTLGKKVGDYGFSSRK